MMFTKTIKLLYKLVLNDDFMAPNIINLMNLSQICAPLFHLFGVLGFWNTLAMLCK